MIATILVTIVVVTIIISIVAILNNPAKHIFNTETVEQLSAKELDKFEIK